MLLNTEAEKNFGKKSTLNNLEKYRIDQAAISQLNVSSIENLAWTYSFGHVKNFFAEKLRNIAYRSVSIKQ